tara:strand:+ start:763 stop:1344 length:582 start_codon:yes stop_codon:yes gene_type:complete
MKSSDLPSVITAGTKIQWQDENTTVPINENVTSAEWTLKYYFRTTSSRGVIVTGSAIDTGWSFTISSTDFTNQDVGKWSWYAQLVKIADATDKRDFGSGNLTIKPSLAFTTNPTAIDTRSESKKELDTISAAIRALGKSRAKEYTIGDRTFKSIDMNVLIARESQLKVIVNSEDRAALIAQGLGDPKTLYVRF